ncbi:hypothetical protein A4X09_0g415 [Tilletia walkeri]|uniref:Uncharacterized protein n=1 Tax=Tilletia walkeri TaxID=117179 RepID=A0A8X7T824_9BASI|nr:hypothetical protein A4X09_0g415 [Tilletia walkeri]
MNAIQATFDLIPSSPTLNAIGSRAVSGWGSIAAAMSFSTQHAPSPSGDDDLATETQWLANDVNGPESDQTTATLEGDNGLSETLITRIRSHSCSSANVTTRDLPWPTSQVLQAQLPVQGLPRSKSYNTSSCDSPRSTASSPGKPIPPAHLSAPSPSLVETSTNFQPSLLGAIENSINKTMAPNSSRHVKAENAKAQDLSAQALQRPASRSSILASASRAVNGSPRIAKLAPVNENDDVDSGLMLPPPRYRTVTMRSNASSATSSSSTMGASSTTSGTEKGRHSRSQSVSTLLGPMGLLGLVERNKTAVGAVAPPSPKKSATTTAVSAVLATCLDNIDGQAAEQGTASAMQFRNPFAPIATGMPPSASGRSIQTLQGGTGSLGGFNLPTSATMPDLSSVLAIESRILAPPARIRTVSSCSNKMSGSSSITTSLPVSTSGVIELQPHASYFAQTPSSSRPWLQAQPKPSSKTYAKAPLLNNARLDPIFNTAVRSESVAARSVGRSRAAPGSGPTRANSLPRGYLPQYKEFREPVPASVMSSPRSAQVVFEQQQQSQSQHATPTSAYHSNRLATTPTWDSSLPIHTLTQTSPTRSSIRRTKTLTSSTSSTSSRRNELLRPIDTELANRKRTSSSKRAHTATSTTYESSSPASSFLDLPPLSACTTSSASSCSSASLDERVARTANIRRHTPTSLFFEERRSASKFPSSGSVASTMGRGNKNGNGSASLAIPTEAPRFTGRERERWESLAYVRAREPFPLESAMDGGAHSWRGPSSPKKSSAFAPSSLNRECSGSSSLLTGATQLKTSERDRRPSSLSSSLSFFAWPSRPSSSSIATRTDRPGSSGFTLTDYEGSESSGWRKRGGQAGFSAVVDSGSEDGDYDGEREEEEGEGSGWSSYVSMQDVHSPVLERSPVFNSGALRPALSRGQSSVPVL